MFCKEKGTAKAKGAQMSLKAMFCGVQMQPTSALPKDVAPMDEVEMPATKRSLPRVVEESASKRRAVDTSPECDLSTPGPRTEAISKRPWTLTGGDSSERGPAEARAVAAAILDSSEGSATHSSMRPDRESLPGLHMGSALRFELHADIQTSRSTSIDALNLSEDKQAGRILD